MRTRNIVSAVAAAAVAFSAVSFSVSAEENTTGYVYFMAEKSTIGQGFTVEPCKVAIHEGDTGLDLLKNAAEVLTEDTGYGAYVTAFADEDLQTEVPEAIKAVCPEMTGRNAEGYLSALDYTAESGWTYFVNDEYAQVGIGDYIPADGDVVVFSFTVYGYGADLGVDNSSWGGAAALKEATKKADLVKLCAEASEAEGVDEYVFTGAMEALAEYEATQEDIDNAVASLTDALGADAATAESAETTETADTAEVSAETADASADGADDGKGSPATGVEGAAVAFAVVLLAGAGIALSKRK